MSYSESMPPVTYVLEGELPNGQTIVVESFIEGPAASPIAALVNGQQVGDNSLVRTINFTGDGLTAQLINGVLTLAFALTELLRINGSPSNAFQINGVERSAPITFNSGNTALLGLNVNNLSFNGLTINGNSAASPIFINGA